MSETSKQPTTPEQRKDVLRRTLAVIHETIADAKGTPMGGIPNGILYTMLMSTLDMSFDTYITMLTYLKSEGYVTESNHVLTATDKAFPFKSGV